MAKHYASKMGAMNYAVLPQSTVKSDMIDYHGIY